MRKYRRAIGLFVLVFSLFGSCSFFGGFADEHWVSPDGRDSAIGNQAHPWKSIDTAVGRAKPGDTIHVMPGIYYERVTMETSGEAGSPIRIVGQPGAILSGIHDSTDGGEAYWGGFFELLAVEHVEISGLTVKSTNGSGIFVRDGSAHISIVGNTLESTAASGIGLWEVTDVVVRDNEITKAGQGHAGAGIQLVDAVRFEVSGNTVTTVGTADYSEDGISVARASSTGTIDSNTVSVVLGRGIVLEAWEAATLTGVTVTNNALTHCRDGVGVHPGPGGIIDVVRISGNEVSESGAAYTVTNYLTEGVAGQVSDVTIDANRAIDCSAGYTLQAVSGSTMSEIAVTNNIADTMADHGAVIITNSAEDPPLLESVTFVNNTFYRSNSDGGMGAAMGFAPVDAASTVTVANNIFAENSVRSVVVDANPGAITVDHNLFTEAIFGADGETHGTNAVESGDVNFVDAAGGDFSLAAGSAAIDAGRSANAPATDFVGTVRPQGSAMDLGAYERVQ